jgi:fumarylacetoacetate (FAA) hydrolase
VPAIAPTRHAAPSAFSPDELGRACCGIRLALSLRVTLNKHVFGKPSAGDDMMFNFAQHNARAARTHELPAGTMLGVFDHAAAPNFTPSVRIF